MYQGENMTKLERIKYMLKMESGKPQKDDAGVYVANMVDSAVRVKTLTEVVKVLEGKEDEPKPI